MGLFDDLDMVSSQLEPRKSREAFLRAPFGYAGGKSRSLKFILPLLPYRATYVEPFGGSASVLLARRVSKLEVFNDRYSGVVAFYRCMRSKRLTDDLIEWLRMTVHSREEFIICRDTWKDVNDPVERAGRWYYMLQSSFGSLGRNWGRATSKSSIIAGKVRRKLEHFPAVHERFACVQVENQDWEQCFKDFDGPDTVFYCDPPYIDTYKGTFKHEMTQEDHHHFLQVVFEAEGFVAVSGYDNPLYNNQPWDEKYEWDSFVSIQSLSYSEGSTKADLKNQEERKHATEVLWVKE